MIKYELKSTLEERAKQQLKEQQIIEYKQTVLQIAKLDNRSVNITIK